MMTVKERTKKMLVDRGMFDEQAEEVLRMAIPKIEELVPNYKFTWDALEDTYPDPLYGTFWPTLQEEALKWIDENLPQAWFREMFTT